MVNPMRCTSHELPASEGAACDWEAAYVLGNAGLMLRKQSKNTEVCSRAGFGPAQRRWRDGIRGEMPLPLWFSPKSQIMEALLRLNSPY